MIDGKAERGFMALSKFVKAQVEIYDNGDKEDKGMLKRILNLYQNLYQHVFDSEDIYIFNS